MASLDFSSSRTNNIIAMLALFLSLIGFYANNSALDSIWPYKLSYDTEGLICKKDQCELSVWINNDGWIVQENVRIETPRTTKKHIGFYSFRAFEEVKTLSRRVYDLGRLHPNSRRLISFYYPIGTKFSSEVLDHTYLNIYSNQVEASYNNPERIFEFLPNWVAYSYALFILVLVVAFIYGTFFQSDRQRFISLSWDLHHARKTLSKSREKVIKLQHKRAEISDDIAKEAVEEIKDNPNWLRPKEFRDSE